MASITYDKATRRYPGSERPAVDALDLEIADGEFLVLVGPSGCGKSTSLRMLAGLEDIDDGAVWIGDRDVTQLPPRSRDIAMVFQNYALYPHMTVRQNLGYALRVRKTPKPEIKRRVEEAAKLLGLDQLLDRRPGALSGGQMQRVAMGRAIVREPKAFLMDEPLSNLDAKLRVVMRTSLQELHGRLATTTVYVTHDQVEEMTLGARVAVMRVGKVQQVDAPGLLYEEPANVFVAAFIGSPAMNLAHATLSEDSFQLGSTTIPLDRARRPALQPGARAIVGVRPESFAGAAFASRDLPTVDVQVEVLESIGSDAYVFFEHDAQPVIVEEAVSDDGDDDGKLLVEQDRALFAARVDARTSAKPGERLTLAIEPSRLYFFSPETGESLLRA